MMSNLSMRPVVLAGGGGTRLWPLSRALFPKQLLALVTNRTMLQDTLARVSGVRGVESSLVICNDAQRFGVAEQLEQMGIRDADILLEPFGRNTAPAVAVAALHALRYGEDVVLLVLPADHVIQNLAVFHSALGVAYAAACNGDLVTFGVKPLSAETGYGYLRARQGESGPVQKLECFVEKPDQETARAFLSSGRYFWNSGMFMFQASVYIEELARLQPQMLEACRLALDGARADLDFLRLDPVAFAACSNDSIDCAVMEKTDKTVVVPLDAGWSDVGSWSTLWQVADKNKDGNVCNGDVIAEDSRNCYLHGTHGRLLTVIGLDDVIVVDTDDVVLVTHKEQAGQIKRIVENLKDQGRKEASVHRKTYRPWGRFDAIDSGARYQVKHISVKPGGKLSVQMHHHRAEHWVVVSGTARVTIGDETRLLTENQSVYIPLGTVHALENPGKIPLELIEVQTGAYLGEDDIVRLQDRYGRE